jgi:hypothetical protein
VTIPADIAEIGKKAFNDVALTRLVLTGSTMGDVVVSNLRKRVAHGGRVVGANFVGQRFGTMGKRIEAV